MKQFKRIVLYARQHHSKRMVLSSIKKLISYLLKQEITVVAESSTGISYKLNIPHINPDTLETDGDLMVVIGGDGSLLSGAKLASQYQIPIIGVNRGQLGFLTDMTPRFMNEQIQHILDGDFIEEKRDLLHARLFDGQQSIFEGLALNDLVLNRGQSAYLVKFSIFIDQQFVNEYRADGLILSTPTGSTAYNLSAGGPILHPQLQAFTMVPMHSHSLNARPLVLPNSSHIHINISKDNLANLTMYLDGHQNISVQPGQHIEIIKHHQKLRLLHPSNYHYYDTLRIKLGWGLKPSC
jgi:NAD+ kinase